MKKVYETENGNWVWDTDKARWAMEKINAIKAVKNIITEREKSMDWKMWPEYLYLTFKTSRLKPGWENLKNLHDSDDQEYFKMLEGHYQRGKLKI